MKKIDRRGGKIIIRCGQGWTLLAQLGQRKTGLRGKGLLLSSVVPQRLHRVMG